MDNYKALLNAQALKILNKSVRVPDYHLMVGCAEDLEPQPIVVYQDFMPTQMAQMLPDVDNMSYEEVQANLASGKLTINDFFQNVHPLGEPIAKV